MTPHEDPPRHRCRLIDDAPLYVLGALDASETGAFEEHLRVGCTDCARALSEARQAAAELDRRLAEDGPPPKPRHRASLARASRKLAARIDLAESLESPTATEAPSLPGVTVVPHSTEGWIPTPAEGVFLKLVGHDPIHERVTHFVRMDPGAFIPAHFHTQREECYVISGEVCFGDQRMHAGDYQEAAEGSHHPAHTTDVGCLLLVISSANDEVF